MRKVRAVVASNIGPKVLLGLTLYFIRNITRAFFTTYCGVGKTNTEKTPSNFDFKTGEEIEVCTT